MNVSTFSRKLRQLRERSSTNEKERIITEMRDSTAAISFLSGNEFDDIGLGKKTVLSVARTVYGDEFSGKPTVSEALYETNAKRGSDGDRPLSILRSDLRELEDLSGNEQKQMLAELFKKYDYPSVVSHAVLNDWPTGASDTTIANALGVRDSLPFYESVVDIVEADGQLTQPVVGRPFEPQLAVPESRTPNTLDGFKSQLKIDGIRAICHVKQEEMGPNIYVYSRRMNNITPSLPELSEIPWPDEGGYILDGEIIASDGSYSSTSKRVGRDAENVERDVDMEFAAFDILVDNDEHIHNEEFRERHERLTDFVESLDTDTIWIPPLRNDYESAKEDAIKNDDEGLILKRMGAPYEFGKRSSSWVKNKFDAETIDVVISGFEEGEGKATGTLGKVELSTADGVHVGDCGSGWSDEQREEVWNNQEDWLGRTIEVEARGLGSQDKLRMPIFKRDRRDDGEPDSWERIQEVMQDV